MASPLTPRPKRRAWSVRPPRFDIDVEDDGRLVVLRLRGELDLATVPAVQDAATRHRIGRRALVVDLRDLEFLDSSGLRLMIELQARQDGTAVAFIEPGDRVGKVLDVTGVRAVLNWVAEPSQALDRDA